MAEMKQPAEEEGGIINFAEHRRGERLPRVSDRA